MKTRKYRPVLDELMAESGVESHGDHSAEPRRQQINASSWQSWLMDFSLNLIIIMTADRAALDIVKDNPYKMS